ALPLRRGAFDRAAAQQDILLIAIKRPPRMRLQQLPELRLHREEEVLRAESIGPLEPLRPLRVGVGEVIAVEQQITRIVKAARVGIDAHLVAKAPEQVSALIASREDVPRLLRRQA